MNNRCLSISIVLFFVTLIIFPQVVSAQSFSLSIEPVLLQVIIKPGKNVSQSYKITNFGDPGTLNTIITAFTPGDDKSSIVLVDCQKNALLSCNALPWLSISLDKGNLSSFFLKTNDQANLTLKIAPPPDAASGDYYLSLIASSETPRGSENTGSSIVGKIVANILLTVSEDGRTSKKGEIEHFDVVGGIQFELGNQKIILVDSFAQIPLFLSIRNTGTNVFGAQGKIRLLSPFLPAASFPLPTHNILAGSSRSTRLTLPRSFYLGSNRLLVELLLEDIAEGASPEGKIGKQPELRGETSFVALPITLTIAISMIVILSYLIMKFLKKSN